MNHGRAGTGMGRDLPAGRARGTQVGMGRDLPAGRARGWPAGKMRRWPPGRAFGLLAGVVLLICAAFIDPTSVLRTDTEKQAPVPRESWTAWTTWPESASFVPGVARADHADLVDHPQRGDDHRKSITIDDFDDSVPGGFPLTWKA